MRDGQAFRPWKRISDSPWLTGGASALAAAGAVLAQVTWDSKWLTVILTVLAIAGVVLTVIGTVAKQRESADEVLRTTSETLAADGSLPRFSALSVDRFRVHKSGVALPYLWRDRQDELLDHLVEGGPVLITGHSMSGKTRMAFEVVRERYGNWRVWIPTRPEGLALITEGIASQVVVWLDDMETFLTAEHPLTPSILNMLERNGCRVVATMRTSEYERFQPVGEIRPPQLDVLQRFTVVRLENDERERERLASEVDDAQISAGIRRYGVAEYIGGGHIAVERFNTGRDLHPLGIAMVQATTDWHRLGFDAIPNVTMTALASAYLRPHMQDAGETEQDALSWARAMVGGRIRLLESAGSGWRAFDFLRDHLTRIETPIPDETWASASDAVTADPDRAATLGYRAYAENRLDIATRLLRLAAPHNATATYNLGRLQRRAMSLRFSVRDALTGERHDVQVTAEPDTLVETLLEALPVQVDGRTCYVGAERLNPEGTLRSSPLFSGVTVTIGAPGPERRAIPLGAVGGLRVIAGPDVGRTTWLSAGRHVLGRDRAAAVRLSDPRVSSRHSLLEVWRGDVTVVDLGSAEGTSVDGEIATAPLPLLPGSCLCVGDDRLEWMQAPQLTNRSLDGQLDFYRLPLRRKWTPSSVEIVLPTIPRIPTSSVQAFLVPILVPVTTGALMAAILSRPAGLLLMLLSIPAMIGTFLFRRPSKARSDRYASERQVVQQTLTRNVAAEERVRREAAPDVSYITLAATGVTGGLWPREVTSADGLLLRVGSADQPASVVLQGEPWTGFEAPTLRNVPVTVDLRSTGVLGIVGSAEPVDALLRWLVVQLGTLRSPIDLQLVVVMADTAEELAWTRWLPHLDAGEGLEHSIRIGNTAATRATHIAELRHLVQTRTAQTKHGNSSEHTHEVVVVLDGAIALRSLPGIQEIFTNGPSVGVYAICGDRREMKEYHSLCVVEDDELQLTRSRDELPTTVKPDHIDRADAERIARAVAPMRDRHSFSGIAVTMPYPVRYLDLLDIDTPTVEQVQSLWDRDVGPTTSVTLGADRSGIVTVDLARQGPHSLIGGASGSGKSVLLQTLITALLLTNRPDQLNLVLVDFKGSGVFLPFEQCPHVVSLIRPSYSRMDLLDAAACRRIMTSFRAEVRRRESILVRYSGEIEEYWRTSHTVPPGPTLPRLVVVISDWVLVLEEYPELPRELASVAAKGRSLGVHLILSSQLILGSLTGEINSNFDLRISLRQHDAAESQAILGMSDAIDIPRRLTGRGLIVCTKEIPGSVRLFQCGYLGNPPPERAIASPQVEIIDWPTLKEPPTVDEYAERSAGFVTTDLALAVRGIIGAATRMNFPQPFRPVLPPLPAELTLEDLTAYTTDLAPNTAAAFGLADIPERQSQPEIALDLAGADRLLVAGGPQSGRTTFARTLITSLASTFSPQQVHLYVIESNPSKLSAYADLPHCGGAFSPSAAYRIRQFITWLHGEVRQRALSGFGVDSGGRPWIVGIIDGWENFENRHEAVLGGTSLLTKLYEIIAAGPPVGVHIVPIGGREVMAGRLTEYYSQRLLLAFPSEETRRGYLAGGVVSPPRLPGRGVEATSGVHVQVARPAYSSDELVRRATSKWMGDGEMVSGVPLRQFPTLPAHIALNELREPDRPSSTTWIPLAVGATNAITIGVDLYNSDSNLLLVSGPPKSGRTTAAATVAVGLRRIGVNVLAIASPRSALRDMLPNDDGTRVVKATTVKDADLREAVADWRSVPYAVIVDDWDQITVMRTVQGFSERPTMLDDITEPEAMGAQALILAGGVSQFMPFGVRRRSLTPVATTIVATGTRILLTPSDRSVSTDYGLHLEKDQYFIGPPGRAYVTAGGEPELIQIARPVAASQ